MRIEERPFSNRENKVLTAMIVHNSVLGRIASKWEGNNFQSQSANVVANWCIEHYKKYGKAPKEGIISYLEDYSEQNPSQDQVRTIETYLSGLSETGVYSIDGDLNIDHVLDTAGDHFNYVKANKTVEAARADLEAGKVDKAEARFAKHSKIQLGQTAGSSLFLDKDAVTLNYTSQSNKDLVEYPGDLKRFFHNALERDYFLCFCGPQKVGKSWLLIDIAWRAMCQRKRVAFFEIGDLSERQLRDRFLVRAARHPSRSSDGEWPVEIKYPLSLSYVRGDKHATVETKVKSYSGPLNGKKAWRACERVMKDVVKSKESYFWECCYPNLSISILGIKAEIEAMILRDWCPDLIVIDYSDNLSPIDKREEPRDRINQSWKIMRAIAMEYHCLLVTATQVKAAGFNKKILDRTDFSEDNRKLSHVGGMIGINVTSEEKELGLSRLNWIVKREGEYSVYRCCHVAGCLALANPTVRSLWP